jgi:protein TonB
MPPYHAPRVRPEAQPQPPIRGEQSVCLVCFNHPLSPTPITTDNHRLTPYVSGDEVTIGIPGSGEPTGSDIFNTRSGPVAPEDPNKKKRISVGGAVQQARLVHRVEPAYPPIAKTLHKSGQVHISALIAVDGSIESLQVIDGDSLLVKSALDAVGQWRYQPTTLNGSPVEVETIITVIYTLNQ